MCSLTTVRGCLSSQPSLFKATPLLIFTPSIGIEVFLINQLLRPRHIAVVQVVIIPMDDPLKAISYAAPAFIAAATIPVVWRFAKNIRRAKPIKSGGLYEDEDGKATEESMASYSTKKSFTVIFLGLGFGLAASFALIVDSLVQISEFNDPEPIWLLFGCWVCNMTSNT